MIFKLLSRIDNIKRFFKTRFSKSQKYISIFRFIIEMEIITRHAKLKDVDVLIELTIYASKDGEYKGFEEIDYETQKDLVTFRINNSFVFVIEMSGEVREPGKKPVFLKNEVVGTTSLCFFDSKLKKEDLKAFSTEGKCMLASSLLIKPFFRNIGLAKEITNFAEEFAKNNDITFLRAIISEFNDAANKLAKESGYKLVKSGVEYLGNKCNLWEKRIN